MLLERLRFIKKNAVYKEKHLFSSFVKKNLELSKIKISLEEA